MIREAIHSVQEELTTSAIAGKARSHLEFISNRAIPLDLAMMKRLGYSYTGETALHLTNDRHLDGLKKIQKSKAQLSTFTIGGPELVKLPSQPNCILELKGTEVIRGKHDLWTSVDKNGMRWINHNVAERSTKFKLTFSIDGIITTLLKKFGVDFNTEQQPADLVLKELKKVDEAKFYKAYLKAIESWIDSGGYKEFQKYLDNSAEMKYNEVVLTKFVIKGVYSLENENPNVVKFCKANDIKNKGVLPSRALSELKI